MRLKLALQKFQLNFGRVRFCAKNLSISIGAEEEGMVQLKSGWPTS